MTMFAKPISADEASVSGAAETKETLTGDELAWEALSWAAAEDHARGRSSDAIVLWQRASTLSRQFSGGDPRIAASLSNSAVADALLDRLEDAAAKFLAASRAWNEARLWSETMTVGGTARSSLFHHRLETRHRDCFESHLRMRYRTRIDAGEAVSAFDHGIVLLCLNDDRAGQQRITEASSLRLKACGASDPVYLYMKTTLAALAGADMAEDSSPKRSILEDISRSGLERWRQERPRHLDDVRRLLGAICLTALFDPHDFL